MLICIYRNSLTIAFLIILSMSLHAWLGMAWITNDIIEAKLPAGCGISFFSEEAQAVFTDAVSCPGKHLVWVWPLPMKSPWAEDWWDRAAGYAVWVHYQSNDDKLICEYFKKRHRLVIAISERSGLVMDDAGKQSVGYEPAYIFNDTGKHEI